MKNIAPPKLFGVIILVAFVALALNSRKTLCQVADVSAIVYRTLNVVDFNPDDREKLIKLGPKAHLAFVKILKDVKTNPVIVVRVLRTVSVSKGDRSVFVEPALARLIDENWLVRLSAADLIGDIGSAKEAPPLISLLNDPESGTAGSAALALGKIGGPRELLALTIWLRNNEKSDPDTVKDVNTAMDQIRKRIAKKK